MTSKLRPLRAATVILMGASALVAAPSAQAAVTCTNIGYSGRGNADDDQLSVSARCPGAKKVSIRAEAGGEDSGYVKAKRLEGNKVAWAITITDNSELIQGTRTKATFTAKACAGKTCVTYRIIFKNGKADGPPKKVKNAKTTGVGAHRINPVRETAGSAR